MMPRPGDVLREWTGMLRGLENTTKYHGHAIANDINSFNSMLLHEAKRLGVPPPKSMPNAKRLVGEINLLASKGLTATA